MALVYVTKWVLTRGILIIRGEVYTPKHCHTPRIWPTGTNSCAILIGSEGFLDLEEAKADARQRFERALVKARAQVKQLEAGLQNLGRLNVQRLKLPMRENHAFEVHSEVPPIVKPRKE